MTITTPSTQVVRLRWAFGHPVPSFLPVNREGHKWEQAARFALKICDALTTTGATDPDAPNVPYDDSREQMSAGPWYYQANYYDEHGIDFVRGEHMPVETFRVMCERAARAFPIQPPAQGGYKGGGWVVVDNDFRRWSYAAFPIGD